ncbi:putative aminopeptidase [Talaromyces proteolyticus]|uniref:Peptide hydrolase n=1 Tax=Talaromyces proteolyticus TaxID=1131652 RepID=A0AAD4KFR2_9EURO|nr:putative aminopeptidase [Talaromyces proteolyticus]KAH8690897.1 putative aminopeptidase [Talaromyces proteolyticus]
MKPITALTWGAAIQLSSAVVLPQQQVPLTNQPITNNKPSRVQTEKYLIELAPYQTRWVTEEEKWDLKLDGVNFMDITEEHKTGVYPKFFRSNAVHYPQELAFSDTIKNLAQSLDKRNMEKNLEKFTSFHTRYYKSQTGVQSATWLYNQVDEIVQESGAAGYGATVEKFEHPWGQPSIVARIPGQTNKTIVLSAHQDSINLFLPSILAAPGADDDGSGTVTILEVLRTLLLSEDIVTGNATNTVEFHWYSAEEGGLLGSQAIFSHYRENDRDVKAMLQQDMTGYIQGTLAAGRQESVGVIVDFVDKPLTEFIKTVITEYCDIPFVETKCGYACSDHASASRFGYPSAFVIESDFPDSDKKIHTTEDKIEYLSFDHMIQHAKMSLAFAYELGFATPSRQLSLPTCVYTMPFENELHIASLAVQRAALLTKSILASVDKGALDKHDNTPVTIADFAAQALIISALHAAFPTDGFVGEESADVLREDRGLMERVWEAVQATHLEGEEEGDDKGGLAKPKSREEMLQVIDYGGKGTGGAKGRVWVLDPVDGTATFIQGQQYAVCLALVEDGRQRIAVLGCPNLKIDTSTSTFTSGGEVRARVQEDVVDGAGYGHMVFAISGHGAFMRPLSNRSTLAPAHALPAQLRTSPSSPSDIRFADCRTADSTDYAKHGLVATKLGAAWPATADLWSSQMRYIAIAVGECNALIKILRDSAYRSSIWDHAGGMLIAEEVGCTITDVEGREVSCGLGRKLAGATGLVVAPKMVHGRVLEAVREVINNDN